MAMTMMTLLLRQIALAKKFDEATAEIEPPTEGSSDKEESQFVNNPKQPFVYDISNQYTALSCFIQDENDNNSTWEYNPVIIPNTLLLCTTVLISMAINPSIIPNVHDNTKTEA